MGLKPVDDILERMGITPEEFDAMSDEIPCLVPTETGDSTENEGRAPSLNLGPLFASQEGLNLPDNIRKDKQQSKESKQDAKKQKSRKYPYRINFAAAVHICRNFFLKNISPSVVEALLLQHLLPIRSGLSHPRGKRTYSAASFLYRIP
jgi:hypothetical protein